MLVALTDYPVYGNGDIVCALHDIYNYIIQNNIQVIRTHSSSYFLGFLIKVILPKIDLIWHDHYGKEENLDKRKSFPINIISKTFKSIISVNKSLRDWSVKNLKTKSVIYLPNFASFGNKTAKTTFLKGEEEKKIVCLANLRPQKDHLNLLKAFKIVQELHSDWTLHLVGLDLKDSYSAEIKSFIDSNHLRNHVFLYGSCSDTKHILEQATIGVLASKSEGLPVALLEYGLAKLPIVVTNVGECGNVVANNINGVVVAPNNENEFAKGILSLIEEKDSRLKFAKNLEKEIKLNYSEKNYIKHLLSIYKFE